MHRQKCINIALQHQLHAKRHLLNTTKRADDKSAMYTLHQNAAWKEQKMKKNAEHAKLWRLRDHTLTLEVLLYSLHAVGVGLYRYIPAMRTVVSEWCKLTHSARAGTK